MSVTIHWALDNNGTDIIQPLEHSRTNDLLENNTETEEKEIYIYHDGANDLTNCSFYLNPFSGTYEGHKSAMLDFEELLEWGNSADVDDFGGYMINMDAANSFTANWPSNSSHSIGNSSVLSFVFNNSDSLGNKSSNSIPFHANMLANGNGETGVCPANAPYGYGANYKFKCKIKIPKNENEVGTRQFDLVMRYTYTS